MGESNHLNIWHSFKQGDWESYATLYSLYYEHLNNYGYKFTKDAEMIEDAIHDLFVRLWTTREKISSPVSVKNYLFKALRNILFRKLKNKGRITGIESEDYHCGFEITINHDSFAGIEDREVQEQVKSIINNLPPRQKEIIYLRFYEGLSYEEIADIMEITISSTYKLFYKAIQNLQDAIGSSLLVSLLAYSKSFRIFFSD